ncbi:Uma2 family endonuclease [Dyadobacter sp. 676]|uniref:Uma2 family endonuclease n=1 Tax=Dyadobacter sp. 676 TaxID=3088362 RepID=A0AAU8FT39_9BACT
MALFSGKQIDASAKSDEEPIPEFLIEVISPTDDAEKVEEKLAEYFSSSVKVVWHIYPDNEVVRLFFKKCQNLHRTGHLFGISGDGRF